MYLDHTHILQYDSSDKRDLYIHTAIRIVGMKLLGVFLPVILYQEVGLTISQIFLFFGVRSAGIVGCVYFISARFVSRRGTKPAMFVGIPMLAVMFLSLQWIGHYPWLLALVPLCGSLFTGFFWMGFHTDMSQYAKEKNFGSKVAILHIIIALMGAFAPLLGGVLVDGRSVWLLIWVGSGVLLLSLVPLLDKGRKHIPVEYDHDQMLDLSFHGRGVYALATFAGQTYTRLIGNMVWPLVIYLVLDSYTSLGAVTTISTLIVVVALYMSGRYADLHQDDRVMKVNLTLQMSNWLGALAMFGYAMLTTISLALVDVFNKLTMQLNGMMIGKAMYEYARRHMSNPVYITSMHEIGNHLCKAVMCLLLAGFFALVGNDPRYLAVPIAIVVIFIPLQYLLFARTSGGKSTKK